MPKTLLPHLSAEAATSQPEPGIGAAFLQATPSLFRASPQAKNTELIAIRHPEYNNYVNDWVKFKLTYFGGEEFIKEFLFTYSKREDPDEFNERKKLTYVANYAKRGLNQIRNSFVRKLPEVTRKGSTAYTKWVMNVDGFNQTMNVYVGLELIPLLLAQGKRCVIMDAPIAVGGTMADDEGLPTIWAVDADNVLSWQYGDDGKFTSILIREWRDVIDPESGLVKANEEVFRFMHLIPPGFPVPVGPEEFSFTDRPMVYVERIKSDGETISSAVLDIPRVPVVEFRLVDPLLTDVADQQVAMLNLSSTDMDGLFKGNFPIYTEQYNPSQSFIKPTESKRAARSFNEEVDQTDRITQGRDEFDLEREAGVAKGVGYEKDLERPGFISPPTSNLDVSMRKQDKLEEGIQKLLNLNLVSMSVKVLEQSGKSKEMDQISEDAGLDYLATVLESGERDLAELHEMFVGQNPKTISVQYPVGYTLKTAAQRQEEAAAISERQNDVPSRTYTKEIQKRAAETLLKQTVAPNVINAIKKEIDDAPYFDANKERADTLRADVDARLVSAETASRIRGYDETEAAKASAEDIARSSLQADLFSGGPSEPPPEETNP